MELSGTHSSLLLPIFNAAELMPWPVTPPKLGAAYQDFLTLWKHADPDIPNPDPSKSGIRKPKVVGREGALEFLSWR
jgi:hypothetical protein